MIPTTLIGGLLIFAWPFVTSRVGPLVVVTITYGCTTGAFVTLIPSVPARLGGMKDSGRRYVANFYYNSVITCKAKILYFFSYQDWYGDVGYGKNVSVHRFIWLSIHFLYLSHLAQWEGHHLPASYKPNTVDSRASVFILVV